jgi:hypothetical protein
LESHGKEGWTTFRRDDSDLPAEAARFAREQVFGRDERIEPLAPQGPKLSLEKVIEALHDNEINAGLQSFAWCGLRALDRGRAERDPLFRSVDSRHGQALGR